MSDIYRRIKKLSEMLCIDLSPEGICLAEIKGYSAGLEMILADMQLLEMELYPLTATGLAYALYCNMLDIDSNMNEYDKRQYIAERLSERYGDYEVDALKTALQQYNLQVCIESGLISIEGITDNNSGFTENLSRILKNFLSPVTTVFISGDGYSFDCWDSRLYMFDKYDSLDIPFYILDMLK